MEPVYITTYNKDLRNFANENRKRATRAEACLWKYVLKAKQLKGYSFNRERPVLNYIADFMCKRLNLIIEIDGDTHIDTKEKDALRDIELTNAGYKVLRFSNDDVLSNIEWVRKRIEDEISLIEDKLK